CRQNKDQNDKRPELRRAHDTESKNSRWCNSQKLTVTSTIFNMESTQPQALEVIPVHLQLLRLTDFRLWMPNLLAIRIRPNVGATRGTSRVRQSFLELRDSA